MSKEANDELVEVLLQRCETAEAKARAGEYDDAPSRKRVEAELDAGLAAWGIRPDVYKTRNPLSYEEEYEKRLFGLDRTLPIVRTIAPRSLWTKLKDAMRAACDGWKGTS